MTTNAEVVSVRLQSTALFSIFEQYQRRSENCPVRLVGAILGTVSPAKENAQGPVQAHLFNAEVRHCFPVPHSEFGDQVSINSEYYKSRMELHRKCLGRESILLGWYTIQLEGQLPKNMDAETFAKNGEFIKDSFARETGSTGAPVTLNLSINICEDGKIKYNVFRYESITSRSQSKESRSSSSLVPSVVVAGVPELFACKQLVLMNAHFVVNTIGDKLCGARFETLPNGKIVIPLPSWSEFKKEETNRLYGSIESIKNANPSDEVSKSLSLVLESLGMTSSSLDEKSLTEKNRENIAKAIRDLETQLGNADRLLLAQSFTSL